MEWKKSIEVALEAAGLSLAGLDELGPLSPRLRAWLAGGCESEPSPATYLDLSDATGLPLEVLTGEVQPARTLPVVLRSRGQRATPHYLERAGKLLSTAASVVQEEPHASRLDKLRNLQTDVQECLAGQDPLAVGAQSASRAREVLGLGAGPILDLPSVIESLGVAVEVSSDLPEGLHGATSWTETSIGWLAAMAVNASDFWTVQRFTGAHELAHVLFEDRPDNLTTKYDQGTQIVSDPREGRAEAFASHFLVPRDSLREYWEAESLGSLPEEEAVALLMWHWGVSRKACTLVLENLSGIGWSRANTQKACQLNIRQMMRVVGLSHEWASMVATENRARPSTWLVEATAQLFLQGALPIENYACAANASVDDSLRDLLRSSST